MRKLTTIEKREGFSPSSMDSHFKCNFFPQTIENLLRIYQDRIVTICILNMIFLHLPYREMFKRTEKKTAYEAGLLINRVLTVGVFIGFDCISNF